MGCLFGVEVLIEVNDTTGSIRLYMFTYYIYMQICTYKGHMYKIVYIYIWYPVRKISKCSEDDAGLSIAVLFWRV